MTRTLPARPNLEHLKHEAKGIHKLYKRGNAEACATLRHLSRFEGKSDGEILAARVKLLDVQQALAVDYGFESWNALKRHIESNVPRFSSPRPAMRIDSYDAAVAHYIDWLGFTLDWEWREAEGQPVIMSLSRDDFQFFLSEYQEYTAGTQIHLRVKNLEAYAEELNERRPGAAEVTVAPPYEFPNMTIADPFGNTLHFEGQDEAAEQKRRENVRPKMRRFVERKLDAGEPFPTPEEVRAAVGPPLGTAIEVLNEFPGYREAYEERLAGEPAGRPFTERTPATSHGFPSHLDFSVGDTARSIRFYDTLLTALGYTRFRAEAPEWQEPDPTRAAWGIRYKDGASFGIDLRPATTNVERRYDRYEPGPHHLAFNVDSDEAVEAVYAAMLEIDAEVLDPPHDYGGQHGYGEHYRAVFFADPDGFKVEVVNARGLNA